MPDATQKVPLVVHWFQRYTRAYLRRHFHSLFLLGTPPLLPSDQRPLIVCVNHSSWWDILVGFHLERELLHTDLYAVMDARQLERYSIFKYIGVLGVDRTSLAGSREFLDLAEQLLKGKPRSLWLTPQGELVSNYRRPIRFQTGLGHLAARLEEFSLVHLTLHYEFWEEPRPEIFASFTPLRSIKIDPSHFSPRGFVRSEERIMQENLEKLLCRVREREPRVFRSLLRGQTSISTVYDLIRRLQSRRRGEPFLPEHNQVVTPTWNKKIGPSAPLIPREEEAKSGEDQPT